MASPIKTPAGTWRIKVERSGYKVQTKTFKTALEAKVWARKIEADMDRGHQALDIKAARGKTVANLFERFIQECTVPLANGKPKLKYSRSSINALKRVLETASFMTRRLSQIQPADISTWRDARLMVVKPSSVDREFSAISAVFKRAQKEWREPLPFNPARMTSRPTYNKTGRNMGWREDQIQAVCDALCYKDGAYPREEEFLINQVFNRNYGLRKSKPAFVAYAFLVALETAMRQGEIARLTVADFNREEGCVYLYTSKNGDARAVGLTDRAYELVSLLCKDFPPEHKIFHYGGGTISGYFTKVTCV